MKGERFCVFVLIILYALICLRQDQGIPIFQILGIIHACTTTLIPKLSPTGSLDRHSPQPTPPPSSHFPCMVSPGPQDSPLPLSPFLCKPGDPPLPSLFAFFPRMGRRKGSGKMYQEPTLTLPFHASRANPPTVRLRSGPADEALQGPPHRVHQQARPPRRPPPKGPRGAQPRTFALPLRPLCISSVGPYRRFGGRRWWGGRHDAFGTTHMHCVHMHVISSFFL